MGPVESPGMVWYRRHSKYRTFHKPKNWSPVKISIITLGNPSINSAQNWRSYCPFGRFVQIFSSKVRMICTLRYWISTVISESTSSFFFCGSYDHNSKCAGFAYSWGTADIPSLLPYDGFRPIWDPTKVPSSPFLVKNGGSDFSILSIFFEFFLSSFLGSKIVRNLYNRKPS